MSHWGGVRICIVGAVLGAAALASTDALAQCCQGGSATGANMWTDGLSTSALWPPNPPDLPPAALPLVGKAVTEPVPLWWTHGEIEAGGRDFLNNPTPNGSVSADTNPNNFATGGYGFVGAQSLAKYYEYSIVAPGAFAGGHVATGTTDGRYQIDLWANNIGSNFAGFSDQAYLLTGSKAGEHYFWFNWDQTPHIYSTSAQTIFQGVGTNALTVPAGLVANPVNSSNVNQNKGAAAGGILPYLYGINLGIQRNTAAAGYRWTPPDASRPEGYAWDLRADYSYMERTGTQAAGLVELQGFATTGVPAPVNDTTQNFGANGEYAGTSLWGQPFTFKVAYNGSIYNDNISSYTVQNPFFPTATTNPAVIGHCTAPGAAAGTANCGSALVSTPPNNSANGISETTTADLPWNSHYVGTFSYVAMAQNATFLPMTNNPFAAASPAVYGGAPWNTVNFGFVNGNFANPISSLNGQINEILSNNVLTSKITSDLTSKVNYRYYDFDNQTPRIIFPCWISYDGTGTSPTGAAPCGPAGFERTISSLTISYVKQDAGGELNWRPTKEWNFNGAVGWERYDYTQTDVNTTNEYSAKLSADWKPTGWLTARASGYYADRRYDVYNYNLFVQSVQFPTLPGFTCCNNTTASWFYAPAYQQFMFDNRQRTKADFMLDVVAFPGVTITPTVKFKDDFYGLNPLNQEGVNDSRSISTGVDVGWVVTPTLSFAVSYYWEYYYQSLYNYTSTFTGNGYSAQPGTCTPPYTVANGNCLITTTDKEFINTVTVAMRWAAIPSKLDFDVRYAFSAGVDQLAMATAAPTAQCGGCNGSFPNDTTSFQRLDATATYRFDPAWVRQMGFNGDVLARLRYTWERNAVANWQNDPLAPFTDVAGLTNSLFLAYDNPNYNVQALAASLVLRW